MKGVREGRTEAVARRRRRVAELTVKGWSASQIAEELNIYPRMVQRDRKAMGVAQQRPPFYPQEVWLLAERLLDDGASVAEVARTIGCNLSHAQKKFSGRGWSRRQSGEWNAFLVELRAS